MFAKRKKIFFCQRHENDKEIFHSEHSDKDISEVVLEQLVRARIGYGCDGYLAFFKTQIWFCCFWDMGQLIQMRHSRDGEKAICHNTFSILLPSSLLQLQMANICVLNIYLAKHRLLYRKYLVVQNICLKFKFSSCFNS